MSIKIITVSRQFGSGGRTIAKELAAKLGFHVADAATQGLLRDEQCLRRLGDGFVAAGFDEVFNMLEFHEQPS